jgi:hypothetical protein
MKNYIVMWIESWFLIIRLAWVSRQSIMDTLGVMKEFKKKKIHILKLCDNIARFKVDMVYNSPRDILFG